MSFISLLADPSPWDPAPESICINIRQNLYGPNPDMETPLLR